VSIKWRNGRPVVEVYDPTTKTKQHVRPRDHGMEPLPAGASERTLRRWAEALERAALNARDARRPGQGEETCDSFATRWPDDYRRGKKGRLRADSTVEHNRERVKGFGAEHAGRPLRSIGRSEARTWANAHAGTVPALRAMFNDALEDGLCDINPFAKLGLDRSRGREDIVVLTRDELDALAKLARRMSGERFGPEVAALILWAAYTCMRPGETFAARFSLLDGDTYDLRRQFNSTLGRETVPKHNSSGIIYVPEPAQRAVLDKPRRLGDDLVFRSKRGRQFRQESLHRVWAPVRDAFTATLPDTHHLRERLAADPDDRLDFYELRHFGASYMLNVLALEPWVIAEQLRHSDGGALVLELYGHPDRTEAIRRIRRAYTDGTVRGLRGKRGTEAPPGRGKLRGA
jgi:integrase